jgi:hypothetical protein
VLRVNEALAELDGFPMDAHVGLDMGDLWPDITDRIGPLVRSLPSTGSPLLDFEVATENWQGRHIEALVSCYPVLGEGVEPRVGVLEPGQVAPHHDEVEVLVVRAGVAAHWLVVRADHPERQGSPPAGRRARVVKDQPVAALGDLQATGECVRGGARTPDTRARGVLVAGVGVGSAPCTVGGAVAPRGPGHARVRTRHTQVRGMADYEGDPERDGDARAEGCCPGPGLHGARL